MSAINNILNVWIAWLLQNNSKAEYIVRLVINYHDSSIFIHSFNYLFTLLIFCIVWIIVLLCLAFFTNELFFIFTDVNVCNCLASKYHFAITFIPIFTFFFIFLIKLYVFFCLIIQFDSKDVFRCKLILKLDFVCLNKA